MTLPMTTGFVGIIITAVLIVAAAWALVLIPPFLLAAGIIIGKWIVILAAIIAAVWGLGALITIARGNEGEIKNPFAPYLDKKKKD